MAVGGPRRNSNRELNHFIVHFLPLPKAIGTPDLTALAVCFQVANHHSKGTTPESRTEKLSI